LALSIGKFGIVASINESLAAKKDPVARAGGLTLYEFMCRTAGRSFEPFAIGLAATVFCMMGDQAGDSLRTGTQPPLNLLLLLRAVRVCTSVHPESES